MKNKVRHAFNQHKGNAKHRGISFELTFDEWLAVWRRSRRWPRRGNRKGRFVMARYNDEGPYSKENVKIILFENNILEAKVGKPRPDMSALNRSRKGIPLTKSHRAKIAEGLQRFHT